MEPLNSAFRNDPGSDLRKYETIAEESQLMVPRAYIIYRILQFQLTGIPAWFSNSVNPKRTSDNGSAACRIDSGNSSFLHFFTCLLFALCLYNPAWGAEASILAIEVTQGLQAISQRDPQDPNKNNIVPLVRGKRTLVRVYFSFSGHSGGALFEGSLLARGANGLSTLLLPSYWGFIYGGGLDRESASVPISLNFELPNWLIEGDEITIGPVYGSFKSISSGIFDPSIDCSNCLGFPPVSLPLHEIPPLKVRLVGVQYSDDFGSYEPSELHYKMIRSWLNRTFPVHKVVSPFPIGPDQDGVPYDTSQGVLFQDSSGAVNTTQPCGRVIAQVSQIREEDLLANRKRPLRYREIFQSRYVGLLSDLGFFRIDEATKSRTPVFAVGCITVDPHPSSEIVSYAPVGIGRAGRFPWDDDGSYGDWAVSHELGHTFGQKHPTIPNACNAPNPVSDEDGRVSPDYPDDPLYVGVDFGDWSSPLGGQPLKIVPGSWFDFMSYCPIQGFLLSTKKWIGPKSYSAIRTALLSQNSTIISFLSPDSSPQTSMFIYDNRRPAPLPTREAKGGFTRCLEGDLGDLQEVIECLRKNGGSHVMVEMRSSNESSVSASVEESTKLADRPERSTIGSKSTENTSGPVPFIQKGQFIRVLATVELSKSKARITFARQTTLAPGHLSSTDDRIRLRVTDRAGHIESVPVPMVFKLFSDASSQEDQRGLASLTLPFKGDVQKIELLLKGASQPVDEIVVSDEPLPPVVFTPVEGPASFGVKLENNSLPISWTLLPNPPPTIAEKITYAVLISYDKGDSWQTIAVNLAQASFEIPAYRLNGFDDVQIRVAANDRFRTSEGSLTLASTKPHK